MSVCLNESKNHTQFFLRLNSISGKFQHVISFRFFEQLKFLVPFLLKIRSPVDPLSEYFGSPFRLGTVLYYIICTIPNMTPIDAPLIYQNHNVLYHMKLCQDHKKLLLVPASVGTPEPKQGALFGTQSLALFRVHFCLPYIHPLLNDCLQTFAPTTPSCTSTHSPMKSHL